MRPARTLLLALASAIACGESVFACNEAGQCDAGFCEPTGYCSFGDPQCPSGRRYGDLAGDGLAGTCVELDEETTSSSTATSATSSTPATTTTTTMTSSTTTSASATTVDDDTSGTEDPVTTTPITSGPDPDSDTFDPSTSSASEASSTTGAPSETTGPGGVVVSFGDRFDADVQDVVEDTTLVDWSVGDNLGVHTDLHLSGAEESAYEVALIRFDVSALPADLTIETATLSVWTYDLIDPGEIEVHALTEDWVEGRNNIGPGVCNWTSRLDDTPWSSEGAGTSSHDPAVLATFALDAEWERFDIALPPEIVELWRDEPSANFGLTLRSTALGTAIYFPSSEEPDEELRPLLVVSAVP